jgi:outer membrane murein-binding lipoprotein Lpp
LKLIKYKEGIEMKKSLFAAALMSLFLAACGQAEKATEAAASATEAAATATEAAASATEAAASAVEAAASEAASAAK